MKYENVCELDARVFVDWTFNTAIPKMTELKLIGNTDLTILVNGRNYILEALNQMKECKEPNP